MVDARLQRRGARTPTPQTTSRVAAVQGGAALALLCVAALGGCAGDPVQAPVAWWHQLEGGPIADQRPPPPGTNMPYPQLGTTPARPTLPDQLTRTRLHDQLAAEQQRVTRQAARTPIVVVAAGRNKPPAPPSPDATSATLDAADAPPPPAIPPPRQTAPAAAAPATAAPATAGNAAAANAAANAANLPPSLTGGATSVEGSGLPVSESVPPSLAPAAAAGQGGTASRPDAPLMLAGATADVGAALPQLAEAPPAPAEFEGVPALPTARAAPPVPSYRPDAALGTLLEFAPGSDQLLNASRGPLHALVARRGKASIAITGNGDAASDQPDAQQVSLDLALRRARSVATELAALGVPPAAMRIDAAAFGRGARARLLN